MSLGPRVAQLGNVLGLAHVPIRKVKSFENDHAVVACFHGVDLPERIRIAESESSPIPRYIQRFVWRNRREMNGIEPGLMDALAQGDGVG